MGNHQASTKSLQVGWGLGEQLLCPDFLRKLAQYEGCVPAGSTQEEVSSIVEASIKDSKISGGDRPVAWDGATMGGQDLQNQVGSAASLVTGLGIKS